jgi:hypothetical protein
MKKKTKINHLPSKDFFDYSRIKYYVNLKKRVFQQGDLKVSMTPAMAPLCFLGTRHLPHEMRP